MRPAVVSTKPTRSRPPCSKVAYFIELPFPVIRFDDGRPAAAFLSLGPVLHLTIAEGPILAARIDKIDPYVFFSHASLRMDLVSDLMEEFLLHLGRSPADPGNLDDDEIAGVVQAEIPLFRVNDLVRGVPVDDLELVVHRDIGDIHHGPVNRFTHHAY